VLKREGGPTEAGNAVEKFSALFVRLVFNVCHEGLPCTLAV
jgi:hypothetical protein